MGDGKRANGGILNTENATYMPPTSEEENIKNIPPVKPIDIIEEIGEPCRIRTCDPLIKSQLLYQLS